MQLVINTYSAYLQKNGDCFKVKTDEGFNLALDWVKTKFANQLDLFKRLRQPRSHKSSEITSYIDKIENVGNDLHRLSGSLLYNRGLDYGDCEGSGGRIYFEALSSLMPDWFQFKGRRETLQRTNLTSF